MSSGHGFSSPTRSSRGTLFSVVVCLAVVLSIVSWVLILSIPTGSINVNTVYEGF
jgi:hypothetical protein